MRNNCKLHVRRFKTRNPLTSNSSTQTLPLLSSLYAPQNENVDEDILVLGRGAAAVEIDLMQPIDADRAPKVHMSALNHFPNP